MSHARAARRQWMPFSGTCDPARCLPWQGQPRASPSVASSHPRAVGVVAAPRSLPMSHTRAGRRASPGPGVRTSCCSQLRRHGASRPPPRAACPPALSPVPGAVPVPHPRAEPPAGPVGPRPTLLGVNIRIASPESRGGGGAALPASQWKGAEKKPFLENAVPLGLVQCTDRAWPATLNQRAGHCVMSQNIPSPPAPALSQTPVGSRYPEHRSKGTPDPRPAQP